MPDCSMNHTRDCPRSLMWLWQLLSAVHESAVVLLGQKIQVNCFLLLALLCTRQKTISVNEKRTTVHWVAVQAVARNIQEVIKLLILMQLNTHRAETQRSKTKPFPSHSGNIKTKWGTLSRTRWKFFNSLVEPSKHVKHTWQKQAQAEEYASQWSL